jgi:Cdc6-like AAA superfamily ATPase
MYRQRTGARFEHREQESQRVKDSPSLADRFRKLKSLTVDLSYYDPEGVTKTSQVKYTVNLANAKSVFRFNCPNTECIRGDFDLTEELAGAVAKKRTTVTGEMVCEGWRSKTTIDTVRCANILRYKLTLAY